MLSLIVFLPIIAGLIIVAVPSSQKQVIRLVSLFAALGQCVLAYFIWQGYDPSMPGIIAGPGGSLDGSFQFVERLPWISLDLGNLGSLNIEYFLGVDGLSITMIILTALISTIGVLSSWTIKKQIKGYFILFNILSTAMMGCFVALDFFLFYVFWELMLLPMYFLIGIWGGPNREYAAIKFFLYTLFGSVFMLLVMIALYFSVIDPATGNNTFSLVAMASQENYIPGSILGPESVTWRYVAFIVLFIGFAIKVPMFPFHTWLPDAHVEAPTPISVILAGVLLKLGTYGMMRINFPLFPEVFQASLYVIGVFGAINIIYGAFCALAQQDLKKLVAYSSISHMGYVLLGLAAANTEGMTGALYQMFNHGTITAMLFLLVGVIYDRAHTRSIDKFGGLATYMPVYAGVVTIAWFASLGLPGLSGFISEAFVFVGAFSSEVTRNIAIVSVLGIVFGAAYLLWSLQRMFLGKRNPDAVYELQTGDDGHEHIHFHDWTGKNDLDGRELTMLVPLALIIIILGVYPMPVLGLMTTSINKLVEVLSPVVLTAIN
ncbi:MAG: NADH-quinone oxidoreductase subunit M [Prosthecochloris sp.]|uniref:Proton-translocating NADH-quinone oxidoreductase, chain M n=1 Tax=Prosthecochloris aestuarii (strain DSM 271 / SK 413) TaxID=290512 RepID=B4S760_PROA2|nr:MULTISPECIES: NADH-quinone oxidoreductase subunit M [Prosthecochloris]ACF45897.1 proton-translocating NADH-quinone oxidoreductase, chain M [Prosthecochloris aestuarii DSM 271]MCW8799200.1 NADH-quinone oxidoreductase subunit M [Prosthecochloris sp.]NEX11382.1 oxidoreductase [Prosthecochloris sp.]RDD30597.1 oxidoreductase [Prosthecochloris sp. ZM]